MVKECGNSLGVAFKVAKIQIYDSDNSFSRDLCAYKESDGGDGCAVETPHCGEYGGCQAVPWGRGLTACKRLRASWLCTIAQLNSHVKQASTQPVLSILVSFRLYLIIAYSALDTASSVQSAGH